MLDGRDGKILLDSAATSSFMQKEYCLRKHGLSKFSSNAKVVNVGNGKSASILLSIPINITILGHTFEIYTMVSEIQNNVGLVQGVKNFVELEGTLSFSKEQYLAFLYIKKIKAKERSYAKVEILLFLDKISGLDIIK